MSDISESTLERLLKSLAAARANGLIAESTERNVRLWLTDSAYADYAADVAAHITARKFRQLDDAFWTILPFGTGGRRGTMYPIGTNVMNDRTVGESAQGLADYLRQQLGATADLSCAIAYDTRNNSERFARLSASVLAASDVRVYIFEQPRSTPQLSFAVRHRRANAGIVISASHNPPSDNGFKCYWSTGGQVLPPHDTGIIKCVENVRHVHAIKFDDGVARGVIRLLGREEDEAYVDAVVRCGLGEARGLRIVFTPLHGVGLTSVAQTLNAAGFEDVHVVESQATPDGNFTNVVNNAPNPENPAVLREAIDLARRVNADLVLASDPDADRIAAAVPDASSGDWVPLSGNQVAGLLAHYVITKRLPRSAGSTTAMATSQHDDAGRPFVVKTLVTTEFITRIADAHGVRTIGDLPVGFKWIADAIDQCGSANFLFGAEESLGYLTGEYARDKDAAVAALLFAELAAEVKAAGQAMLEHLDALYCRYGYHVERAVSKSRPGREGAAEIAKIMSSLRLDPPQRMSELNVARVHDFVSGDVRDTSSGRVVAHTPEPRQSQVMLEFNRPGWRLVARPSGTEPKIKFYLFGVVEPQQLKTPGELATAKRDAASTMDRLCDELEPCIAAAVARP